MARRATRNAQQAIYRLYFGAFGTQFYNLPVRGPYDHLAGERGGGCQILFGRIIYFQYGLGRKIYFHVIVAWAPENLFSCKHGKPQSRQLLETVMLLKAVHL